MRELLDGQPPGVPRGEQHVNARLSVESVREIRRLHAEGFGYGRIAKAFNISRSQAERIVKRRAWAHVK